MTWIEDVKNNQEQLHEWLKKVFAYATQEAQIHGHIYDYIGPEASTEPLPIDWSMLSWAFRRTPRRGR